MKLLVLQINRIIVAMVKMYNYFFIELADPRTNNWFLVKHPVPLAFIMILYIFFALGVGTQLMRFRKAFDLRKTLVAYNILQVFLSTHMFLEGFTGYWYKYKVKCEPVDYSWSKEAMRAAEGCYVYYMAKLLELMDTIFFIVRKKHDNLSFLHIYHHTLMPVISWGYVKYIPGGHGLFIGMINSFVHIIMYSYYLITALGPRYRKYVWWKNYLTELQLVQMGVTFVHSAQLIFIDCGYPRWTIVFTMPNSILFLYLFNKLYISSAVKCPGAVTGLERISSQDKRMLMSKIHKYVTKNKGINSIVRKKEE